MKTRILFILLCFSLTFAIVGCNKNAKTTSHEGHAHAADQPCGSAPEAPKSANCAPSACATCPKASSCGTASKVISSADEGKALKTPSGLKYIVQVKGSGASPRVGQTVSVHYTGYLTNGTKFDSSHDRGKPIEFQIGRGRVIKGWDEGIALMKVGEKRRLIIPPHLGYGTRGAGRKIPPNATLIFDTELVAVK